MDQLLQHLKQLHRLSTEMELVLRQHFEELVLPRGEYLITEGQVCRRLYFLQQGCLRGYYTLDGKEITHWFGFENDFVTSFHSFITQQPAVESIQLLEGCVLWSISKEALQSILNSHHELERLLRIAYEKYYIKLEERFVNAQFKTAKELYEDLLERTPHIIERVPLGHVASYLGISQETLSRIRSRI
ncbi:MAG: Crp/Fnr family transcriptional regulator [Candidatus Pseudobacter hemicellulosilyticus]|uniref:Crp/Fnr family transcriptional regulator n=1 Tax=Candidatus Pseudobacter hemicellulosilyticus TaxID=3121375 RepID=A0AAJ6BHA5_9BACT|nr:MAG: Crp/Fnr family transcriptional regulator [Pseudobacter sp.]